MFAILALTNVFLIALQAPTDCSGMRTTGIAISLLVAWVVSLDQISIYDMVPIRSDWSDQSPRNFQGSYQIIS